MRAPVIAVCVVVALGLPASSSATVSAGGTGWFWANPQPQGDLDALAAELVDTATGLTYYHEIDNTLYSATSSTFIGELYSLLGLVNIADPQDVDGFGFPQLFLDQSTEVIVVLSDRCQYYKKNQNR